MKRLVLVGEGHSEVSALPTLIRKLLSEKQSVCRLPVETNAIRFGASRVFRWDRVRNQQDYTEWLRAVTLAGRRSESGAVLALYDGDLKAFPPGSGSPFCATSAAKALAAAAREVGGGKIFSVSVVFACTEYETWLVAGLESLRGRHFKDGRLALPAGVPFPSGHPESHGKRWLEQNCPNYRAARDQLPLTEMLDLQCVRSKGLRSFRRLEHALDQLLEAVATGSHVSTPG